MVYVCRKPLGISAEGDFSLLLRILLCYLWSQFLLHVTIQCWSIVIKVKIIVIIKGENSARKKMIKLWFKLATKYVHPGDSHLRARDNHQEHCHSRDQVIIVMIMTGNDHFPLLHSSRSKLFFIVSNILTFLHCVRHFNFSSLCQIFSDLRYVTLLPGPRMKSSCLRYFSTSYDHQLWSNIINYDDKLCSMMVLRFTRTRSHRLIFLQTSQRSQTPPAGKSTNTNTQKNNIQTKQFKSKVQKSLSCQLICFSH